MRRDVHDNHRFFALRLSITGAGSATGSGCGAATGLQAGKPVVPVAVLNAQAAALRDLWRNWLLQRLFRLRLIGSCCTGCAGRGACCGGTCASGAAGPVDAAAQTHKAVGTGVARRTSSLMLLSVSRGMIHAVTRTSPTPSSSSTSSS